jgi:hypothetical protein
MNAPIPRVNYAGMPLGRKYTMMHSGSGGAAAVPAADTLAALAPEFATSCDAVAQVLSSIGVSWQGQAATAFTAAMRQGGQWVRHSSQASQAGGGQVHTYASSYDATRARIPAPVEVGQQSGPGAFLDAAMGEAKGAFGIQSDYSRRLGAYQGADAQANAALATHENTTRQALAAFPTITDAPPLTAGAAGTVPGDPAAGPPAANAAGRARAAGARVGAGGAGASPGGQADTGAAPAGATPAGATPAGATPAGAAPAGGARAGGWGGMDGTSPEAAPAPSAATTPTSWSPPAPLTRRSAAPSGPGEVPGGLGNSGMPDMQPMPDLPPMSTGGSRYGATGYPAPPSATPPGPRGGTPLPERASGGALGGPSRVGGGPARSMPAATPPLMGGTGGVHGREDAGQGGEYRNTVYLASDDPFHIDFTDEIVPAVLTNEDIPH